jgi:hypothetical protein
VEQLIDALPDPDLPPGLPPKLLQLLEEEDRIFDEQHDRPELIALPRGIAQRGNGFLRRSSPETVDFEQLIRELKKKPPENKE